MNFTKKVAKEIAMKSFLYVIDCIRGNSDSGYHLGTEAYEFEDNFEEDIEEKGFKPTTRKVVICKEEYEKLRQGLDFYLDKKY